MNHCTPGRYHIVTPVETHWRNSKQVRDWVSEEGKETALLRWWATSHLALSVSNTTVFVLSDVLLKGVSSVCSVINCLTLICCSDRTSYSLNSRWHTVFHTTLCYFWREACILQIFLIKPSLPMQDPKWPLITEEGITSQGSAAGWHKHFYLESHLLNLYNDKHSRLQFTKLNPKSRCLSSWERRLSNRKQVSLPPWNSDHKANMKHIKLKKPTFLSDFIIVHILSALDCLSPIFFPLK